MWRRDIRTNRAGVEVVGGMSITEETRRAAHEAIKPKFGPRAQAIYTALREQGDMTAEELTDYLVSEKVIPFFDLNYVRPRLTEMKQAGYRGHKKEPQERQGYSSLERNT